MKVVGTVFLWSASDDAVLHEVLDDEDGLDVVAVDHGGLGDVREGAVLSLEVIAHK